MKIACLTALVALSFILLSASCKKQSVQPVNQLSLLPAATQTGAGTFGCLLNGLAFIPKKPNFLENPMLKCAYGWVGVTDGYIFNLNAGNIDSQGFLVNISVQTDSLKISQGQILPLTNWITTGRASGIVAMSDSQGLSTYLTNLKQTGQLSVTHLDTIKMIVSGTFYFIAVNNAGDTVKVTDGRFDMPYGFP